MKYKTKRLTSLLLAFSLVFAMFAPATSAKAETAEASEYVGDWGEGYAIPAEEFARITGEATLRVDYRIVEERTDYQFKLNNKLEEWVPFTEEDFTYLEYGFNEYGFMNVHEADTSAVVVMSADAVAELADGDGLCVQVFGLIIDNVTVTAGLPTETVFVMDESYPKADEWGNVVSAVIPAEAFLQFEGEVAVTLDYVATGELDKPYFGAYAADWGRLTSPGHRELTDTEGTITLVLNEKDVAAVIAGGGLMFHLTGVYFTRAELGIPATDDAYAGDWNICYWIPPEELSGLDGTVSLEVQYRLLEDASYSGHHFMLNIDEGLERLTREDFAFVEHEFNTEHDIVFVPADDSVSVVVLNADVVAEAVARDGIMFQAFGLIIEDVTIVGNGIVKETYVLDDTYPEADEEGNVYSAVIPAEAFMQFDGAVALDLEFEKTGTGEWPGFLAVTTASTSLALKGNTSPWAATESLTVMLEKEQVELAVAEGGLRFMLLDMFFTEATLRPATPDDAYVGDWNKGYEMPASELSQYTGKVAIIVDYRMLEENPYQWCNFSVNEVAGWRKLSADEYAFTEYKVNQENQIDVPATDSTAVVVLPEETVAKLVEKEGLVIQVYGIIIEDVKVMSATTEDTFTLCTSYPEPDCDGNVVSAYIPPEALFSHGENVAFTVDYVTTGTVEYPYAIPRTLRWTELTPEGNVTYKEQEGTLTFVFDALDIFTAIAEGGILFQLDGVYITEAKLAPATAEDYYAGDWNPGYRIPASELAKYTGDLALYIDYRTLDDAQYEYPCFSVDKSDSWDNFTAEDFVYSDYPFNEEYDFFNVPTDKDRMLVVLTAEAVAEALAEGGILMQVCGVIIENITLADGLEVSDEYLLDDTYPAADEYGNRISKVIPATAFLPFDGAVALDLEFETTGTGEWPGFTAKTAAWTELTLGGNTTPWSVEDTLTVVLDAEQVKLAIAEGGIMFAVGDMYFTKATLREATPDDYYVGDWSQGYLVPASEFADYQGDVAVVIDYRPLEDTYYDDPVFVLHTRKDWVWEVLTPDEYGFMQYKVAQNGWTHVPNYDSKAVVVFPAETVAKFVETDGLLFQVNGIIIEDVKLVGTMTEDTFVLDSDFPELDANGNAFSPVIPAEALVKYADPIAITLDYVTTEQPSWQNLWYHVETAEGTWLESKGSAIIYSGTGSFTIVLELKALATAIAEGGIRFRVGEMYFTNASLRTAMPDDYYTGDGSMVQYFSMEDLAKLSGDATLTLKYRTVSGERDWYGIRVRDTSNWRDLSANDFVNAVFAAEGAVLVDKNKNEAQVTIKEATIQRLIAENSSLHVLVYGLLVDEVTLRSASDVSGVLDEGKVKFDSAKFVIEAGVPDDGRTYLQTYEIYDENGVLAGVLEFRAGTGIKNTNWWTAKGVTQSISVADYMAERALYPAFPLWNINTVLPEADPNTYNEYSYKIVGQKVLTEKLPTVTNVAWDTTRPRGWIMWDPVEGADSYILTLKRDGMEVSTHYCGANENQRNVAEQIKDAGVYTVDIETIGGRTTANSEVLKNVLTYEYTLPDEIAEAPEKVWWTTLPGREYPTVANWTPVAGARGYFVMFSAYEVTETNQNQYVQGGGRACYNSGENIETQCEFSWWIDMMEQQAQLLGKEYTYRFNVRALSGDVELLAHSRKETWSDAYMTLDELGQELKESIATDGLESVLEVVGAEEVADAMMSNEEVLSEVAQAEEQYVADNNVTVLAPVSTIQEIAADNVRVVGAGLNVESGNVGLVIKEAESKIQLSRELYHNVMQFDISLTAGNEAIHDLKVPVAITMVPPKSIALDRLVVLHAHNGVVEKIFPTVNADGTITFAVTGFSTFAFAGVTLYDENGKEDVGTDGDFGEGSDTPVIPENPKVELDVLPEGSLVIAPAKVNSDGYGYTKYEMKDGALAVSFEAQYQEIRFELPEAVDLSEYDKLVVTLETSSMEQNDSVVLKVIPTDAEADQYNNPTPITEAYSVVRCPGGNVVINLSEFADKKVDRFAVMASDAACDVNIYRLAFIPRGITYPVLPDLPEIELSTLPEDSEVFLPAETEMNGYGYAMEEYEEGALTVSFDNQYMEIQFDLPSEVDLSAYDKMVVTLATTSEENKDAVALKVVATDAELDEYNNLTPLYTEWGVTKYPGGDVVVDLSEYAGKKVKRLAVMANESACDVFIYRIAFLPKEGTTPDTPSGGGTVEPAPTDSVEAFVARIYRTMLEREPDAASQDWVEKLTSGTYTGAQLVEEFFGSAEFEKKNRNLSNERFVQIMYRTLFNREADPSGQAVWVGYQEEGYIRRFILAGLANSVEFQNLCNGFGITPGTVQLTWAESTPNLSEREFNVWQFVERLYVEVLGRFPDQVGMQDWVNKLLREGWTGAAAAEGFIMSKEFLNKDMTPEQFVQTMYRVFFDRDADPTGLSHWTGLMAQGHSKRFVFAGCANSGEFRNVCDGFGITRGDIVLTTAECTPGLTDQEIKVWDFVERLYVEVLGRPADSIGLADWARKLLSKEWTGAGVAEGFILSREFMEKTMTDEAFVRIMYKAFFGREADADGLRNLVNAMAQGSTKQEVFAFFAGSEEFGNLCRAYGIDQ